MSQMSESDIPIDIHYSKLLDWLINRRHCKEEWQKAVLTVREKINSAIQDMPPHEEITQLLQGTYINYFHCLRIVEILKDTEITTKNIFGRYSSQRMKDWLEIVNLYEKDDLYLAEAAQLLMRNVSYEIPALKKQIAKCQQNQKDFARKKGECAKSAVEIKEKYKTLCKQMGIKGKKVKSELVELAKDLPTVYKRIGENVANLKTASQFYSLFVGYTLKNACAEECVPLVKYMAEHGNVTTYEWRTGEVPKHIEEPTLDFALQDEDEEDIDECKTEEIDWGDLGEAGIDVSGIALEGGTNGIHLEEKEKVAGNEDEIDWGDSGIIEIEIVEDSSRKEVQEGVAEGSDALTLLDNKPTRDMFINELLELEAFLMQRLQEMKSGDDVLSISQFQSAPASLFVNLSDVQAMLTEVKNILEQLNSSKMQDLILLRGSPRYVHHLAEKLKKTMESSEKMLSMSRLMDMRQEEALEEQRQLEPKVNLIRSRTKELQKQMEAEISKRYHNRRVNIMGEINTV